MKQSSVLQYKRVSHAMLVALHETIVQVFTRGALTAHVPTSIHTDITM